MTAPEVADPGDDAARRGELPDLGQLVDVEQTPPEPVRVLDDAPGRNTTEPAEAPRADPVPPAYADGADRG